MKYGTKLVLTVVVGLAIGLSLAGCQTTREDNSEPRYRSNGLGGYRAAPNPMIKPREGD